MKNETWRVIGMMSDFAYYTIATGNREYCQGYADALESARPEWERRIDKALRFRVEKMDG